MKQEILSKDGVVVFVDIREQKSKITDTLRKYGINTNVRRLSVGDYIISDRVVIERKNKRDFNKSLTDGRLLKQAQRMKEEFKVPLIILEGDENLFNLNEIHPNAIRGALSSLTIDYNIPILPSSGIKDTALLIATIAKREQKIKKRRVLLKTNNKPKSLKKQQIYLLSSLPGIGPKLAKNLLKKFKTIRRIINAPFEKLKEVELIGEKKAKKLKQVFEKKY